MYLPGAGGDRSKAARNFASKVMGDLGRAVAYSPSAKIILMETDLPIAGHRTETRYELHFLQMAANFSSIICK